MLENETESQYDKIKIFLAEFIKIALFAALTVIVVRYFLFKPFSVKGKSMEPAFFERDYLIIDEISYRLREPKRGEVVVFHPPVESTEYYLKRIIGLPGERIILSDNKIIVYNEKNIQGIVIEEAYIDEETDGSISMTLGPDQYFVLGDNRDASLDSRRFGPITKNHIIGKVLLRGFPFDRFSLFSLPSYNF